MKMVLLSAAQPLLAQQPAQPGGGMTQILFLGLMFAAMYFLMIAPQRKKQKQHEAMLRALEAGDEVVTAGGIYAHVVSVKEDRLVVRIADNTRVELGRSFVSAVLKKSDESKK